MINRSVIILRHKQPFIDWVRSLDEHGKGLPLEEITKDPTAYLVPQIGYYDEQQAVVEWCYDILFNEELFGWWTEETAWPKDRDLKMFLEWFEVEFHSMVLDICDEPILVFRPDTIKPADDNDP